MGVIGQLLCLFCKSGCQASTIASALAFHPPKPSYQFVVDEKDGSVTVTFLHPDVEPNIDPHSSYRAHFVQTRNGSHVAVIRFDYPGATTTLLFSHGNATDLGLSLPLLSQLCRVLKVNVIGYDYCGYGASSGFVSEKQTYRDIDAVVDWYLSISEGALALKFLVLYGQSVGSGPSSYVASQRNIGGLILHSAILSGLRVITDSRGVLACCDIFPNIDRVARVRCPVFLIHGEDDAEVGLHHGVRLQEAVPTNYRTKPWWVPFRGHNDVVVGNEAEYFSQLSRFLRKVDSARESEIAKLKEKSTPKTSLKDYIRSHPIAAEVIPTGDRGTINDVSICVPSERDVSPTGSPM